MYPDNIYTETKTSTGLTTRALNDAESFFSKEFLRCSDGVIVLVGDLPAEDLQKYLAKSIGGFRVSKNVAVRAPASYRMGKGVSTYSSVGDPTSISIGMAAAHPFTTESYMAFRIASLALKRKLSGIMAEQGFSVSMSQKFRTVPQEAVELIFKFTPVPEEGLPLGVKGGANRTSETLLAARKALEETFANPINPAELAACKSLLANEYSANMADPAKYADSILMRYSAGKDVLTDYAARINGVTADNVKQIFGSLSEGMRIEYVVKPGE
jgi:predicted Zn-dependent peptidase